MFRRGAEKKKKITLRFPANSGPGNWSGWKIVGPAKSSLLADQIQGFRIPAC